MQVQKISSNNATFGAKLAINTPEEFSSKVLEILTKKAEKVGFETDTINITLSNPREFNTLSNNCIAFAKRAIICSVTNAVCKTLNKKEMNCISYGNISMAESTEKRISKYLDELRNKIRK